MEKKKKNTIITLVVIALILFSGIIFFLLNYSSDDSSLTILEKKWITDYANKMVDVEVFNDVPVYGYNGNGMIFDFLDVLTDKYDIQFNKTSYYTREVTEHGDSMAFLALNPDEKVQDSDILLYEDHFVVLGVETKDKIKLTDLENIGILKSDSVILKEYFGAGVLYSEYEKVDELITDLKEKKVSYIVIPSMGYMDKVLNHDLDIVYHIQDLTKKYVFRVSDETIHGIMKKSYLEYLSGDYFEDYSKNYLSIYFQSTNTTDFDQKNYNAKAYKYGYVIHMPYENYVNQQFVGTISNYLREFEKQTNVEIEVVRYDTVDDLKTALVREDIDFALGNFDYTSINMESMTTGAISDLEYLVLSRDEMVLNSIKGLRDVEVSVVGSSILYHLCNQNGVETKNFMNTDDLIRNMDDNSVVLMDKETYLYYKDTNLKDYKIVYEDSIMNGYRFLMNDKNGAFNKLFDYYIDTVDYSTIRYQYQTDITLTKDYTGIWVVSFIAVLVLFMVFTVILVSKKAVVNTAISKEDILKYIDPMTSLKNRSYLNLNIYKWDDNVIFPQSVMILDLNGIRDINDRLGREAGDEVIRQVAGILINNQLENTDIIRSGGDEFLIYMVGYDEKKVADYMKKLVKEMKDIPHSMGVEAGYSMILDEVKTVDDAINEAIIMIKKNKEKRK